jgi:hypothetical protein
MNLFHKESFNDFMPSRASRFAIFVALTFMTFAASAQTQLSPELRQKTDKLVNESLAKPGVSAQHTQAADPATLALRGALDAAVRKRSRQ